MIAILTHFSKLSDCYCYSVFSKLYVTKITRLRRWRSVKLNGR